MGWGREYLGEGQCICSGDTPAVLPTELPTSKLATALAIAPCIVFLGKTVTIPGENATVVDFVKCSCSTASLNRSM